uniref:Uncharacterized protein n=1 Tax=Ornithorhynchus anatinus TaxID=9258 RepID=F7D964_ORNAN
MGVPWVWLLGVWLGVCPPGLRGCLWAGAGPGTSLLALLADGDGPLGRATLGSVLNTLAARVHCPAGPCGKCLNEEDALALLGRSEGPVLGPGDVPRLSAGALLYLSDPLGVCADATARLWGPRAEALLRHLEGPPDDPGPLPAPAPASDIAVNSDLLSQLMRRVLTHYRPEPGGSEPCVDAGQVLAEAAGAAGPGGRGPERGCWPPLLDHVLAGSCFHALPPPGYFVDYVFRHVGNESRNLTLTELSALMGHLRVGKEASAQPHDHTDPGHHDHVDHSHSERRRRRRRNGPRPGESRESSEVWDTVCLSASELLEVYGIAGAGGVSPAAWARLSPALVQQQLSGACLPSPDPAPSAGRLTQTEKYLYGSLATLLVCLGSLVGLVFLSCSACAAASRYVTQTFLSLAVGSLTGDAVLHLIPKVPGPAFPRGRGGAGSRGAGVAAAGGAGRLLQLLPSGIPLQPPGSPRPQGGRAGKPGPPGGDPGNPPGAAGPAGPAQGCSQRPRPSPRTRRTGTAIVGCPCRWHRTS